MRLVCERPKLLTAAQAASEVAPTRPTRPIAQGVLFEVKKDSVELAATDYDVGIRYTLETKKREGTGRAVVNAAQLLAVVRDLTDGDVELKIIWVVAACILCLIYLFKKESWRLASHMPGLGVQIPVGAGIGFLSSMMGVGGATYITPFLQLYGRPIHQAIGI